MPNALKGSALARLRLCFFTPPIPRCKTCVFSATGCSSQKVGFRIDRTHLVGSIKTNQRARIMTFPCPGQGEGDGYCKQWSQSIDRPSSAHEEVDDPGLFKGLPTAIGLVVFRIRIPRPRHHSSSCSTHHRCSTSQIPNNKPCRWLGLLRNRSEIRTSSQGCSRNPEGTGHGLRP